MQLLTSLKKKSLKKRKGKKSYERIEVKKKKYAKLETKENVSLECKKMWAKWKLETSTIVTCNDPFTSPQSFGKKLKRVALLWRSCHSSETACVEKSAEKANYCE